MSWQQGAESFNSLNSWMPKQLPSGTARQGMRLARPECTSCASGIAQRRCSHHAIDMHVQLKENQQVILVQSASNVHMCSVLVSAADAEPLMEAASQAAQPPPEADPATLGRGQRKRSDKCLAELGERAFKRLVMEGQAFAAGAPEPTGLPHIMLLGSKLAKKEE